MEGFEVRFKIWANSQEEADKLAEALQNFVNNNGQQGRYITALKTKDAIERWEDNFFVKTKIINYYKDL